MKVPFIDLARQNAVLGKALGRSLAAFSDRCDFILGQDEKQFEAEFAAYCGGKFAVGLNSGTDALFLSLKALGIGPGDEVIVPAFTFIATAFAVTYCGARPVFCDIDPQTYCLDPDSVKKSLTRKTKAVIPVHLFGQCAEMDGIVSLARDRGIRVVEDACQAHGAAYGKKKAGSIGDTGCFSFYPTKNLGGWGDGGMAVTSDECIYKKLLLLRDCGRKSRYEHAVIGYNSRLDSIQAAVLRLKLKRLDAWNRLRQRAAHRYDSLLSAVPGIVCPVTAKKSAHVFHVYAIRVPERDGLAAHLREQGIGVMINYPLPLHLQEAYSGLGYRKGSLPAAERTCREIISLPIHPYLTGGQIRRVCKAITDFYTR